MKLNLPTFHTQGIAFTQDRIFLSAVSRSSNPRSGARRPAMTVAPAKESATSSRWTWTENLQRDILLGHSDMYHPGGIDFDGVNVRVPVAEYRPDSRAVIYRVDATTLQAHQQFKVADHCGAIVLDQHSGHLVGSTCGSRRFAEGDQRGGLLETWNNPSHFIDFQDCQYVPGSKMICADVLGLPPTPSAGGSP